MENLGFFNRVLRVNLTTGSIAVEEPGVNFFRLYMGGRNIASYYLLKEVGEEVDPLGEENELIVATSVVTGSLIPGSSRFTVAAKSPLTGGYGDGESGGWFGPELKFAGYDAIIVEGVAKEPVYLSILDDDVEIKTAKHLWGKDTGDVQNILREELGQKRLRIIQCGIAGEHLVRFANVVNDLGHFVGRCGIGAVMGSKKLRAIAVKGSKKVPMRDEVKLREYAKWFGQNSKKHPGIVPLSEIGTSKNVMPLNAMGLLPTRNFQEGSFDAAEKISGEHIKEIYGKKHKGCYACPIQCKQVVEADDPKFKFKIDGRYGAPEYETIGSLGSNCLIDDAELICKANELCARYGMDTISTGVTIAFAMECYEKGLIGKDQTEGVELKFGNGEALLDTIEKIAHRRGIGDLLAEGSYRSAEKIGRGAVELAMTAKKQELPAHEPRGKWGVGLGFAVSPTGADHLVVAHDSCFESEGNPDEELFFSDITDLNMFGITEPLPAVSLDEKKIRLFYHLQSLWSIYDVLDICIFVGVPETRMMTLNHLVELTAAVTGWRTSVWELFKAGEKSITLSRAYNILSGLTEKDDALPKRLHRALKKGAYDGVAIDEGVFEEGKKLYYEIMGWDSRGIPTRGKLVELGIGWVDDILRKYRNGK